MSCPNCNFSEYLEKFKSYSNIQYKKCKNCKCIYQDPITELNYSDNYWQGAIDPDGIKRNFTKTNSPAFQRTESSVPVASRKSHLFKGHKPPSSPPMAVRSWSMSTVESKFNSTGTGLASSTTIVHVGFAFRKLMPGKAGARWTSRVRTKK